MLTSLLSRWKVLGGTCVVLLTAVSLRLAYQWCWLGEFSVEIVSQKGVTLSQVHADYRVAVLRSEYSAKYLASGSSYDAHVKYWQGLLRTLKIPCEVISDARLEEGPLPHQVLVLPSALCLSKKERENIRSLLKEGKGVICTWATGVRDDQGNWKGWDFLQELTGADSFQSSDREPPWLITFSSASPVTVGVPAASRVQVSSPERVEATALRVDGYWSTARLAPVQITLPSNFLGAVLRHQFERGRVVWFGFQENSAVAGGSNKFILDSALANALAWAGQRVLCAVEPWPAGKSAAVILALDVESQYENAAYAARALLKSRTKGTFFCETNLVKRDRDLVLLLGRAGELASRGDTREGFTNRSLPVQFFRLGSSRWTLWRLGKVWATGFHAPEEVLDPRATQALAGSGFHYYLTSSDGAYSVLPETVKVSQKLKRFHRDLQLVRLARMTDDDLHLSPLGIVGMDPNWIVQRVLNDFEMTKALSGLYILAYHTQGLSSPEYASVLTILGEKLRAEGAWMATAEEVVEWWEKRNALSFRIWETGSNELQLTLICTATQPIEGPILSLYPPEGVSQAQVTSVGARSFAPVVIPEPLTGRVQLVLGKLDPGKIYQYKLRLGP